MSTGGDSGALKPDTPQTNASSSLFINLPIELLEKITSQLDVLSLIQLSRVARPFLTLADDIVWRDLKLALPGKFDELSSNARSAKTKLADEYKLVLALQEVITMHRPDWRDEVGRTIDRMKMEGMRMRHQTALLEKGNTIMARANETRWPLVKSLHLDPRRSAFHPMLDILERVAPTLESLRIEGTIPHVADDNDLPETCDPLQVRLMQSTLHFPSLQHLRLRSVAWTSLLVLHLCQAAPNLTSLDIEYRIHEPVACSVHPEITSNRQEALDEMIRSAISSTKLKALRFRLFADNADWEEKWLDEALGELVLYELLVRSTGLEQFVLDCESYLPDLNMFGEGVCGVEPLRDLYLTLDQEAGAELWRHKGYHFGYEGLRRLVLNAPESVDMLSSLPYFPNLEIYFFGPFASSDVSTHQIHPGIRSMPHWFTMSLHHCFTLSIIHPAHIDSPTRGLDIFERFDELERTGDLGRIRSLVHGEAKEEEDIGEVRQELLFARLLLTAIESPDHPSQHQDHPSDPDSPTSYPARDRSRRERVYTTCPPTWQEFSNYDGRAVPYEIIAKVLEVEGIAEADWTGRRVHVGEAAWKVLTDWRDADDEKCAGGV